MGQLIRSPYRRFPLFAAMLSYQAALFGTLAAPIDPHNPPEGRFADDWMEIHMGGGKVGFAHSTMTRNGDRVSTETTLRFRLGRAVQPISIEMTRSTEETLKGKPLSFDSETNMSSIKTGLRGTVTGDRVTIVTSQLGMEQKQEYPFPSRALMAWGLFREGLVRGFRPGLTYTVETYDPDLRLDGPVKAVTQIGEWEEFELGGQKRRGQRTSVTMESPFGTMEMISWVDTDGTVLTSKLPMPGMGDLLLLKTDQKSALTDFVPPEIFLTSVIPAKQPIHYKKARRITYRLSARNSAVSFDDLPETDVQRILRREENAVKVALTRARHEPIDTGGRRLSPNQLAEYVDSNLMINVEDPELIKLARRAAGEENDPFALGDRLRRFVTGYVKDKNLNIGFATASEVARNREGDCSEHGVLLAALGRIAGLPSRVAVGLAYVPVIANERDVFGYHMWTQFYIDGRWIDFDAALGESVCSPIRIAFATSSLKSAGLTDLSLPLLSKTGAIDIDVESIEP